MQGIPNGSKDLGSVNNLEQGNIQNHKVQFGTQPGTIVINGESYTISYKGKPIGGQAKKEAIIRLVSAALQHIDADLNNRTLEKMTIGHETIAYETTTGKKEEQVPVQPKKTNEHIKGLFEQILFSKEKPDDEENFEEGLPQKLNSPGTLTLTQIPLNIHQQQNTHEKDISFKKEEKSFLYNPLKTSEEFEDNNFHFEDESDIKENHDKK